MDIHLLLVMYIVAIYRVTCSSYEIELTSFEIVPGLTDTDFIDQGTMRLKQVQRNSFVFTGTIMFKRNFGQRDSMRLEFHKKIPLGNRYALLFMTNMNMCEITKLDYYPKLLEVSDLPPPGTCPFPKGNYTINNLVIDESFLPPIIPQGECMTLTTLFSDGKPVYGARMKMLIK